VRFLIHDRHRKFTTNFDQFLISEGITIEQTPFQAPQTNAVAERWVRSVRHECLDHLLILNQRHLLRVLKAYTTCYNAARPHQGINQQAAIPFSRPQHGDIHSRDVLGGILRDYYRDAA
jgi:putative transposase